MHFANTILYLLLPACARVTDCDGFRPPFNASGDGWDITYGQRPAVWRPFNLQHVDMYLCCDQNVELLFCESVRGLSWGEAGFRLPLCVSLGGLRNRERWCDVGTWIWSDVEKDHYPTIV